MRPTLRIYRTLNNWLVFRLMFSVSQKSLSPVCVPPLFSPFQTPHHFQTNLFTPSTCQMVAFALGSMSRMPSVQNFAYNATLALLANFLLQSSFFLILMRYVVPMISTGELKTHFKTHFKSLKQARVT